MDGYEVANSAAGKRCFRPWPGIMNPQELDAQAGHLAPFFAWLNDAAAGYLSEYVMSTMKNGLSRKDLGVYWPANFDPNGEVFDDRHQRHWGKEWRDGDSSPTELKSAAYQNSTKIFVVAKTNMSGRAGSAWTYPLPIDPAVVPWFQCCRCRHPTPKTAALSRNDCQPQRWRSCESVCCSRRLRSNPPTKEHG